MSDRPTVSVVMPFAGDAAAAREALEALRQLRLRDGDELILADNSGLEQLAAPMGLAVVRAAHERSPAHARNTGAGAATGEWILFLDADCRAPDDLLDRYFAEPVGDRVGAVAGEVRPAPAGGTLAERYGAARSFLGQEAHLTHSYLPRAVAANLMVRRTAFEELGGFYEGLRAAEDTDFCWRLQRAGWRLEPRPAAAVEHRYRTSLRELRTQWRAYAAGRAWLGRRYPGFTPQPALERGLGRGLVRLRRGLGDSSAAAGASRPTRKLDRYLPLDALLAVEELTGFALSNRPERDRSPAPAGADGAVVLVADRFPARGDPLADFARTLGSPRVEARARPQPPWIEIARELEIAYREDEGFAERALALVRLVVRHPLRCLRDLARHHHGEPSLAELAPAALRLERQGPARVQPLGGEDVRATAERLAALAGRRS